MKALRTRAIGALAGLVAVAAFAAPAVAGDLSISGGTPVDTIPQGNSVLLPASIGFAGGKIWTDATLRNESDVTLTLYDVGSESEWKDQIQMLNSTTGATVWDNDDHGTTSSGGFVNGSAPFQLVKSFNQNSGVTNMRFYRASPAPKIKIVVNGQSPAPVPGSGPASIAFAYLDDTNQIVGYQTNRILVLYEDGASDRDYDDYVGILEGPTTSPPPPPPPGDPSILSISGGTAITEIPQGNSGNDVLGPAGIGFAGGKLYVDGTLDILGNGATLTLYDVGSESHWINEIRLSNSAGSELRDWDDHFRASGETSFTNGSPPFQLAGSVTQPSGVANFAFHRIDPTPEYLTVANGQSPMLNVPDYQYASIALAYLDGANQIVAGPTDRVLVLLEDGGTDRDYDDYVGILTVLTSAPPVYPISPNALVFGYVPRNTSSSPMTVTITNAGSSILALTSVAVRGANAGNFVRSNHCPSNLAAGGSCTVTVVFTPSYKDARTAHLDITAGGSAYVVGLFGYGT